MFPRFRCGVIIYKIRQWYYSIINVTTQGQRVLFSLPLCAFKPFYRRSVPLTRLARPSTPHTPFALLRSQRRLEFAEESAVRGFLILVLEYYICLLPYFDKVTTKSSFFFYPSRRLGISSRFGVHFPCGLMIYRNKLRMICNFFKIDDIHGFTVIFYESLKSYAKQAKKSFSQTIAQKTTRLSRPHDAGGILYIGTERFLSDENVINT